MKHEHWRNNYEKHVLMEKKNENQMQYTALESGDAERGKHSHLLRHSQKRGVQFQVPETSHLYVWEVVISYVKTGCEKSSSRYSGHGSASGARHNEREQDQKCGQKSNESNGKNSGQKH